jgi:hypothetical protein
MHTSVREYKLSLKELGSLQAEINKTLARDKRKEHHFRSNQQYLIRVKMLEPIGAICDYQMSNHFTAMGIGNISGKPPIKTYNSFCDPQRLHKWP